MSESTVAGDFDLNVERVLEHWTVAHAVRELIANALDEAALTGTAEPVISKDSADNWHVRDFGRGLSHAQMIRAAAIQPQVPVCLCLKRVT